MRRVLDASVAFKWVVPETDSDRAIRLRDDYRNQCVELISPDIFGPEVAHSLMRAEVSCELRFSCYSRLYHTRLQLTTVVAPRLLPCSISSPRLPSALCGFVRLLGLRHDPRHRSESRLRLQAPAR